MRGPGTECYRLHLNVFHRFMFIILVFQLVAWLEGERNYVMQISHCGQVFDIYTSWFMSFSLFWCSRTSTAVTYAASAMDEAALPCLTPL